jgi:hypothetical protein
MMIMNSQVQRGTYMTHAFIALRGPEKKREDLCEMTATTAGFQWVFYLCSRLEKHVEADKAVSLPRILTTEKINT